MKVVFELSAENVPLAAAEVSAVLAIKRHSLKGNLLLCNISASSLRLISRLAFSRAAYRLLFSCPAASFMRRASSFGWFRHYRGSFAVRIRNFSKRKLPFDERSVASAVWKNVRRPVVNLSDPASSINVFVIGRTAFCCLLVSEISHDFNSRRPQHRPGFSPVSLHPKLARAIVNLSGIRKGDVLDPFCGTGGLLIEAGLMGFGVSGSDIDSDMLVKCKLNLDAFGVRKYRLRLGDALALSGRHDFVIADLPYGQSSSSSVRPARLYASFLMRLRKILRKRAVIVFPGKASACLFARKAGLKVRAEFAHYIHKSLTKRILVLSRF